MINDTKMSRDFETFIRLVKDTVEPKPFAHQLTNDLKFFKDQSSLHPDVKLNPEFILKRWIHFAEAIRGTDIMERLKARAADWAAIEKFVQAEKAEAALRVVPKVELGWDVEKLFHHFFVNAHKMPQFRGQERLVVLLGLKYLISEASKPKVRRDRAWIMSTWNALHPLLEREGMLVPFKNETVVRDRLRAFIRGSL